MEHNHNNEVKTKLVAVFAYRWMWWAKFGFQLNPNLAGCV